MLLVYHKFVDNACIRSVLPYILAGMGEWSVYYR